MTQNTESLTARFEALHAERVRTWPAERLARNVAQRADLVAAFDPAGIAQVGEQIEPFDLADAGGKTVSLDALVADGPAVLIFFRFAGCPACNIALPYYDRQLRAGLAATGVKLFGVSPHLPEKGLGEIVARHGLGFPVLADRDNRLGRRLGITFARDERPTETPAPGWIGELTGTGTHELPQPTVVLIDQSRTVRFVDTSPDWLVRTEAAAILAAVEGIKAKIAA